MEIKSNGSSETWVQRALKQTEQYGNGSLWNRSYSSSLALKQTEQYGNGGGGVWGCSEEYGFKID